MDFISDIAALSSRHHTGFRSLNSDVGYNVQENRFAVHCWRNSGLRGRTSCHESPRARTGSDPPPALRKFVQAKLMPKFVTGGSDGFRKYNALSAFILTRCDPTTSCLPSVRLTVFPADLAVTVAMATVRSERSHRSSANNKCQAPLTF